VASFTLRFEDPRPRPCKICAGTSTPFGTVDFNKSCEEARGKFLPSAGVPVAYRRCDACGLVYTEAFDDWPAADFEAHIYNAGYGEVDPDYDAARPDNNARMIASAFGGHLRQLRVLDYGGGNGRFAATLAASGFAATTYDPFHPDHSSRPAGRFDLVTCFETLEHMPDPQRGAVDIASFLEPGGMLIFSTLVQPANFEALGLRWWYIGPRNGHVTLHTRASLAALWRSLGLQGASFNDNVHVVFRSLPAYAAPLVERAVPWRPR